MKELQITVAGHVGTGKTAVAQVIAEILENYGIECVVEDHFDGIHDRNIFRSYCAVQALAKQGLKVRISTHQMRKSHIDDSYEYQKLLAQSFALPKSYFTDTLSIDPKDLLDEDEDDE